LAGSIGLPHVVKIVEHPSIIESAVEWVEAAAKDLGEVVVKPG
jgi:hypothetical protein